MPTHDALMQEIESTILPPGQCAFWWLGQHGFAVKLGKTTCLLDAFLATMEERQVPPLLNADELRDFDFVAGSHDHLDHIDPSFWPALAASDSGTQFIVPALVREKVTQELGLPATRVYGVDLGQSATIGQITIHGVPAAHERLNTDTVTGLHPYLGFVLEGNGFTLYHAGDTCIYEGMQAILRRWRLDLAFLPINGRDAKRYAANCIGNMTYQEAVDLAGTLEPGLTVPTHYEMFAMNSEDPVLFVDYMKVKYPSLRVHVPKHGMRMIVEATL